MFVRISLQTLVSSVAARFTPLPLGLAAGVTGGKIESAHQEAKTKKKRPMTKTLVRDGAGVGFS